MRTARHKKKSGSYEVCKRFRRQIEPLQQYLIDRVGDRLHKGLPARVRLGKRVYRRFNRHFWRMFHLFLVRRRRKKSNLKIHDYAGAL